VWQGFAIYRVCEKSGLGRPHSQCVSAGMIGLAHDQHETGRVAVRGAVDGRKSMPCAVITCIVRSVDLRSVWSQNEQVCIVVI